jgi:hypothetical protein
MFPPHAESLDSFSLQPAPGQREMDSRLSESRKPAEGLSRRFVLAGVASAAAMPAAAAIPTTEPATIDPAFALIAEKLAADAAHGEAINAYDEAERDEGINPDAAEEADQRCCDACGVVNEADWRLATTPPRTLAGVAAVLRLANEIHRHGWSGGLALPAAGDHGRGDRDHHSPDGSLNQDRQTLDRR